MKRTLMIIASLLLVILVPIALFWLCLRPVPSLDGTEYCAGLDKAVIVKFDDHAVPYIEAYSEGDAFQAQGYVTARDRMFQMDTLRRLALGRMSQVYGMDCLQSDRLMRTLGMESLAENEWQHLSKPARDALESYASGVNAYLNDYSAKLPVEFSLLGYAPAKWRAQDSLAVMKYLAYKMDESWRLDDFRQRVQNKVGEKLAADLFRDDLAQYGLTPGSNAVGPMNQGDSQTQKPKAAPKLPPQPTLPPQPRSIRSLRISKNDEVNGIGATAQATVLAALADLGTAAHRRDDPQPRWGSTAWAIPAAISQSANTLLACDKDGGFTVPSEWYLCSLNAPSLHVAGAAIPGVPGIAIGRNEGIAWGSANLKADVQDIFLEQFKSQFDRTYKVPAGWNQAELDTELIPVRFGSDVEHRIFKTRHGPILMRVNEAAISLAWSGFNTDHPAFESMLKLDHANTIAEVNKALTNYSDPPQLFIFGDRSGTIGYQVCGNIPSRVGNGQGTMLNPGWENKGAWQGFLAQDKLPHGVIARSRSAPGTANALPIVAANQQPSNGGNALLPKIDPSVFLGHQWSPPYRANRLLAAITTLSATKQLNPTEMNQLQGDQYSQLAPLVTRTLQNAALTTNYIDGNGVASISSLIKWDGQMRASGAQASIFEGYLQTLMRRILQPKLGPELSTEYLQRWPLWTTQAERVIRDRPLSMLPPEERTFDTFFLTTLAQSMKSLHITTSEDTPGKWIWGTMHQALFRDLSSMGSAWFSRFLRLGPVGVGGSGDCVNSCDVRADSDGLTYWCLSGPTERMIIDMGDNDKFYQGIGTGQSGHFFSRHRDDQLSPWAKVDLIPIAFSPNQMIRQIQHRLVLENEFGSR